MNQHTGHATPSDSEGPTCPYCEQPVTTTLVDDTFTYGAGKDAVELHVQLPVRRCNACDFEFVDHVGERIRTEAVYRHHGLLTPWEIRAIRERRNLSRAAFSEITSLGEATIKRWERGATAQNRANDRYLRLLDNDLAWATLKRIVAVTTGKGSGPAGDAASAGRFRLLEPTDIPRERREFRPCGPKLQAA